MSLAVEYIYMCVFTGVSPLRQCMLKDDCSSIAVGRELGRKAELSSYISF